ncbi:MAG: DUF2911 domain-containing protein [Bacteroidota bacterium]|jgi:hypothetical protein|nr:DUF2911 domain-containing protein [Algoriphagus sp.]
MKLLINLILFTSVLVSCTGQSKTETSSEDSLTTNQETITNTPAPKSPRTASTATIDGNQIQIDYSSPSVRGRQIFGGLVGYGEVWVTGAHKATSIQFDNAVVIEGKVIPAGKYGLFTIPMEGQWTIILNEKWDMHLADEYDSNYDILRINRPIEPLPNKVESLTFSIDVVSDGKAQISIAWDKTKVKFELTNS